MTQITKISVNLCQNWSKNYDTIQNAPKKYGKTFKPEKVIVYNPKKYVSTRNHP